MEQKSSYMEDFLHVPRLVKINAGKHLHQSFSGTLFILYKNLVYKNIKAWNCSKIKNIVVILLVAIFIFFEGFDQKMT